MTPELLHAAWAQVEALLAALPPRLAERTLLLKHDLAAASAPDGQPRNIGAAPHTPPLLTLHSWLLQDLLGPADVGRAELELGVTVAQALSMLASYTCSRISDDAAALDAGAAALVQLLSQLAAQQMAALIPGSAPFWPIYHAAWAAAAEARIPLREVPEQLPLSQADLALAAGALAPLRSSAAAALQIAQRNDLQEPVLALVDELIEVLYIREAVSNLSLDLQRRQISYPIARVMAAAGLRPEQLSTGRVMLALISTGALAQVGAEQLARLERCASAAAALGLPRLVDFCALVREQVQQMIASVGFGRTSAPGAPSGGVLRQPTQTLPVALRMAEAYLLSDLTFAESWDVQRQGLGGHPTLTGSTFAPGLVLELLCAAGHQLVPQVDAILGRLHTDRFRYYDRPEILLPDIDVVGLALRLLPWASDPCAARALVAAPLDWLLSQLPESGALPVWFAEPGVEPPPLLFWGDDCLAVQAQLLLGLLALNDPALDAVVERSGRFVLEQLARRGVSSSQHYMPTAALWISSQLIAGLQGWRDGRLAAAAQQARGQLEHALSQLAARAHLSAQDAALLTLSAQALQLSRRPGWLLVMLKAQRYDGSWRGEPLYIVPNRGGVAVWYASRAVTTALCYRALQIAAEHG